MKILLLNHDWLAIELRALGHEVVTAGLNANHLDVSFKTPEIRFEKVLSALPFQPDRIVYWDDSALQWFLGIEEVDIPTVFYSVDTHHHHLWHIHFAAMFDCVLVAQRDFIPLFEPRGVRTEWFPLWAMRTPEASPDSERTVNVSFVGTLDPRIHPKRTKFFDDLRTLIDVEVQRGDYRPFYKQAKIVINETVSGDLKFPRL